MVIYCHIDAYEYVPCKLFVNRGNSEEKTGDFLASDFRFCILKLFPIFAELF